MLSRESFRRARASRAVDSHDTGEFPVAVHRTRLLRLAFAATALALLVAAAGAARDLESRETGLLPNGTIGVVVLDLSLSIVDEDYRVVRGALRSLIAEDAPVGLVVFSDLPYELLPPGTPASQMRPMLRLLVPEVRGRPPVNPWTQSFRGGTRISAALELARTMLERDRVAHGSILLVSDLETAPDDVPALGRTVDALRRSSIQLRAVGLGPSSDALRIFEGLLEKGEFAVPTGPVVGSSRTSEAAERVPMVLLLLGALFLVALALHERFGAVLALARAGRTREAT